MKILLMQLSYTLDGAEDASALTDIEPFNFNSVEFWETTDFEVDAAEDWLEEHSMEITITGDGEAWLEEPDMDITDTEDIPETWQEEHLIDITDNEGGIPEAWQQEKHLINVSDNEGDISEAWRLEEHLIDVTDDEEGIPEAWHQEEHLIDITDNGDIPEAWQLEEHLIDITDDEGDIAEAWQLEEHLIDITDDEEGIPEVWHQEEHLIDITDNGDIPQAWQLKEHLIDITDDEGDISEACLGVEDEADTHIPEAWQIKEKFSVIMYGGENSVAKVIEHLMYGTNRDIFPLLDASFHNQVVLSPTQQPFEDSSTPKVSVPEFIFLMINIFIELLSAAFEQLSSVNKPRYALIAMLMSFSAAMTCIIELAYRAGKERVTWKWESKLPWFYHSSPSHRRFGTFPEMIGLVSAVLQTILSAIAYTFYLQHSTYPLKVSFWPLLFAMGLFCSKFM